MKKKAFRLTVAAMTMTMLFGTRSAAADAIRVGSLKGPTSMGLVSLIQKNTNAETAYDYDFTMVTAADELLGQVISGNLDIALVPANIASILYNKTEGQIQVIDINTLGVLYVVEGQNTLRTMADLAGKTICLTGKGTTPDYVLQYLLAQNGLDTQDVTLEYKSEAAEVVSLLTEDPNAIGLLPQPFVTSACMQNENLRIALDLTEEWNKVQENEGSRLVTGVTIVSNEFLEENPEAVADFLTEHQASAAYTNENPREAAELIAAQGIVAKAPIAEQAIPYCNITCIQGEEMKSALEGYLQVLYDLDPTAVGGELPDESFYYLP